MTLTLGASRSYTPSQVVETEWWSAGIWNSKGPWPIIARTLRKLMESTKFANQEYREGKLEKS